jgi:protoporphyrinogen oxidase
VTVPGAPPFLAVAPPPDADEPTFRDWVDTTFGAGFAKHFFEPYNRKMWRRDLAEVTGDWVSWSIPRPELADVLRGAITRSDKAYGYNPAFLYPRAGGIDHLPRALAATLPAGTVRTGAAVTGLDAGARRVICADGATHDAGP